VSDFSTRPYLIRAIYEWCVDGGFTPYLAVSVDEHTEVPQGYVKDGEIVLNISSSAVQKLQLGNEMVTCTGRFGGVATEILVPVGAVIGIFAKESGQGLAFSKEDNPTLPSSPQNATTTESGHVVKKHKEKSPNLRVVK